MAGKVTSIETASSASSACAFSAERAASTRSSIAATTSLIVFPAPGRSDGGREPIVRRNFVTSPLRPR